MLKFGLRPGRVRVNHEAGVRLLINMDDSKIFLVDMHSKYGGYITTGYGPGRIEFHIYPGEETIHLDESNAKPTILWVEGLEGEDWVDIAVWRRYSLYVSLFRNRLLEDDDLRTLEVGEWP